MKKRVRKLYKRYKTQVLQSIFLLSQKDIDDITKHVLPLKKGDRLLVESNNPDAPQIAMSLANDVYFEQGYASTAIFLLNIVEYGKSYLRKDSYIYPALFCIRMYLEIIMKLILYNYGINIKGNGHRLMNSWKQVKTIIDTEEGDKQVDTVEELLSEIDKFDPMATAFRYPKMLNDQYNKFQTDKGGMLISIRTLRERFLQLYVFFDGLYNLSIISQERND